MVYVKEFAGSIDDVCARLVQACAEHAFGVLAIHDLTEKMHSKGVAFDRQCRVLDVCNPKQARDVLEADMTISTALPCRISVYEDGGRVFVATLLPTGIFQLFDNKEMVHVAHKVEETLLKIVDLACK